MIKSSIAVYRNAYLGLSTPIWWLAMVMFVNRAGTMVLPFMTVYLREEMDYSIAQAGWEIAFFGIGAVLGNFVGGRLTDRIGFYQVQFWSLFLNGILFIVLGRMQTFWQTGACMFAIGTVGEAFRPANAAAIAYHSLPENRTRSYSLNRLAINLGFSIGPAIGGLLSYQALFWVDGITCVLAAILLRIALPPIAIEQKQYDKKIKTESSVWHDRVYLRFTFFVFLSALCFLQMFSLLPVFYKEQLNFSKSVVGIVLALNGLIIVIIEMVLVFKLEGKRSPVQYISLGAFFIGLSYLMLNLPLAGLTVAIIAMIIITIGEMLMFPFINSFWINRSHEHNRGQYASLFSMSFALAHVFAPTFGSQVVQYSNYHVLWYIVFALCVIASIGFYRFKKYA
ncbi:MAG TPA: MFS transporter [Chitinophagaceae bacterium]|jgi:predicted MFS family arabinose efflux permease|nr:MFS transporter [Chitinophagaceae bacterium]